MVKFNESLIFDKDENGFELFKKDVLKLINHKIGTAGKRVSKTSKTKPTKPKETKKDIIPLASLTSEIYYTYVSDKVEHDTHLQSQVLQQTLKKLDEAYKSYYAKLGLGMKDNKKPKYLAKNDRYNAIYQNNSFLIKKHNGKYMLRLSLGFEMPKNLHKLYKNDKVIYVNDSKTKYITIKNLLRPVKIVKKKLQKNKSEITPKVEKEVKKVAKKLAKKVDKKPKEINKPKYKISYYSIPYNGKTYKIRKDSKLIHDSDNFYIPLGKIGKEFYENQQIIKNHKFAVKCLTDANDKLEKVKLMNINIVDALDYELDNRINEYQIDEIARLTMNNNVKNIEARNVYNNIVKQNSWFENKIDNIKLKIQVNNENIQLLDEKLEKELFGKKILTEVELIPLYNGTCYNLALKYDITKNIPKYAGNEVASIDLGTKNLIALNTTLFDNPILIDGRGLISSNQKHNTIINDYKGHLTKMGSKNMNDICQNIYKKRKGNFKNPREILQKKSRKKIDVIKEKKEILQKSFRKKSDVIKDKFNKISDGVINYLKQNNINQLVIGYNRNWKYKCKMGRKNNREFYEIPYRSLIDMMFYKGEEKGIKVVEINESYTSICDALSLEKIGYHEKYRGKRSSRLFKSSTKETINADVNAQMNILRKYLTRYDMPKLQEYERNIQKSLTKLKKPKKICIKKFNELKKEIPRIYTENRIRSM